MQCELFRSATAPAPSWAAYLGEIAKAHCPYLAESIQQGLLRFSCYEADSTNLQELYLAAGIAHTEILRATVLRGKSSHLLYCENLFCNRSSNRWHEDLNSLQWAHWALKALYTESGFAFGKFWPNEGIANKLGVVIPDPPAAFISIRFTIKKPDQRFFRKSRLLADKHRRSSPEIADTFEQLQSAALNRLRAALRRKPELAESPQFALDSIDAMAASGLLSKLLAVDAFSSILDESSSDA